MPCIWLTAREVLKRAEVAAARIERGIQLLNDATCLEAFRIANRAIQRVYGDTTMASLLVRRFAERLRTEQWLADRCRTSTTIRDPSI